MLQGQCLCRDWKQWDETMLKPTLPRNMWIITSAKRTAKTRMITYSWKVQQRNSAFITADREMASVILYICSDLPSRAKHCLDLTVTHVQMVVWVCSLWEQAELMLPWLLQESLFILKCPKFSV